MGASVSVVCMGVQGVGMFRGGYAMGPGISTPCPYEQTHACENITFSQLLLRWVITRHMSRPQTFRKRQYLATPYKHIGGPHAC